MIAFAVLCLCFSATAQQAMRQEPVEQQAQRLADTQQWNEIVHLLGPMPSRPASLDFYYGLAEARLQHWDEAERALQRGWKHAPGDARFPVELAGIAFTQKNYPLAALRLQRALRLAPKDAYANDFLATVYYLEGNLDAALKYWNRVGKPAIVTIRNDPEPGVSPALLDHAFAFSQAGTLSLRQLLDTDERLRGLGIFPQYTFDLQARHDGNFDVVFRNRERDGLGDTKWEGLFLLLRGLPFEQVNPEFYNFHRQAINFVSQLRWDAQKRRAFVQISGPLEHGAQLRWQWMTDIRDENWDLHNSFTGTAPTLASLNLRTEVTGFSVASYARARLRWAAGVELSHRNFRNVVPGALLTPQMLAAGYELKQDAQLSGTLLRVPERRFVATAHVSSQAARLWSQHSEAFEKLTGGVGWTWFPQAVGNDYAMQQQFRMGRAFGQTPFDELFMLGLERDNDLPMRAHIGTRDGRKGSAPLGRNYILQSWELDKNIYGNGLVALQLGPFLDVGKINDPGTALGSHDWLWDTGAQVKLRVFGSGIAFSYGKDLRTGNNAFYLRLLR